MLVYRAKRSFHEVNSVCTNCEGAPGNNVKKLSWQITVHFPHVKTVQGRTFPLTHIHPNSEY